MGTLTGASMSATDHRHQLPMCSEPERWHHGGALRPREAGHSRSGASRPLRANSSVALKSRVETMPTAAPSHE